MIRPHHGCKEFHNVFSCARPRVLCIHAANVICSGRPIVLAFCSQERKLVERCTDMRYQLQRMRVVTLRNHVHVTIGRSTGRSIHMAAPVSLLPVPCNIAQEDQRAVAACNGFASLRQAHGSTTKTRIGGRAGAQTYRSVDRSQQPVFDAGQLVPVTSSATASGGVVG